MANPRTVARIESRIKQRAAHCLQFEINDPRSSFVTITRVEMSTDLKKGDIFYSCLGSEADRRKTERMIAGAQGFIQRQVARVLEMRTTPHLSWAYDDSVAMAADLQDLIANARQRDDDIRPEDADSADGDETEAGEAAIEE
ncbi:MAG: ribosome-binding factor A [Planctomycetota bacterium]|jgi:ribosome-binding factor A